MSPLPITIWLMRHRNKEGYYWLHNHIEDGHVPNDSPIPRGDWQAQKWAKQAWIKVWGHLDGIKVILPCFAAPKEKETTNLQLSGRKEKEMKIKKGLLMAAI